MLSCSRSFLLSIGHMNGHQRISLQRHIPRRDGIDHLLVERPDLVPLHVDHRPRGALSDDELLQALHGHAPPEDAADRREAWIVPTIHQTLLHEPRQFALRQHSVVHVEARVLIHMQFTQL